MSPGFPQAKIIYHGFDVNEEYTTNFKIYQGIIYYLLVLI